MVGTTDTLIRGLGHHSLSYSSSCISEFFDAREYATDDGAPSEYSSDEDFISDEENEENSNSSDEEQIYEEAAQLPNSISSEFASLETQSSLEIVSKNIEGTPKGSTLGSGVTNLGTPVGNMTSTLTRMTGRRQKLPAVKPDTSGMKIFPKFQQKYDYS